MSDEIHSLRVDIAPVPNTPRAVNEGTDSCVPLPPLCERATLHEAPLAAFRVAVRDALSS